jgi:hypothetical protein
LVYCPFGAFIHVVDVTCLCDAIALGSNQVEVEVEVEVFLKDAKSVVIIIVNKGINRCTIVEEIYICRQY